MISTGVKNSLFIPTGNPFLKTISISSGESGELLIEDVIRYMTVKQEGPLPTPRPSAKSSIQADDKGNQETKVESKEEQSVVSADTSTSGKDDTETKENAES